MRILLVEDDEALCAAVAPLLEREGYRVDVCRDGDDALYYMRQRMFGLCILDRMLPGRDGLSVLRAARAEGLDTPVLMTTALGLVGDRVDGLDAGADDYLVKPFDVRELLARVRSQLRRYLQLGGGQVQASTLIIGGICLDDNAKTVTVDGDPVALTPKEYDILRFLMRNAGTVFSPNEIYRRVWEDVPLNAAGAIAVHIRHLREKLEINPSEPRYIKVVWGKGYKMEGGIL